MIQESNATLAVETVASLSEVDAASWDFLAPQDPLASQGWLRLAEEELRGDVETRYLLARMDGQIVGGVPCYLCHRGGRLIDPNQFMFGRFRRLPEILHLSFVPTMLVGPFRSYGPKFLLAKTLDETTRRQTMDLLSNAVEDLARTERLAMQIPRISSEASETSDLMSRCRHHMTQDFPVCYLDIEWSDFDGYLGHIRSFSPKMRRNIKEEINRFCRSGIRIIKLRDLAAHETDLLKIAKSHYLRVSQAPFPFSDHFFVRLKDLLGDELVVYGAVLEDKLIGFVLMLKRGTTAYLPMTGIAKQWTGNEGTYFNLCFYRPIKDAIANGLERLYFGGMLYFPKVRRGCRLLELQHAYRGTTSLRHHSMKPWFAFHSTWMRRRMIAFKDLARLRQGGRN